MLRFMSDVNQLSLPLLLVCSCVYLQEETHCLSKFGQRVRLQISKKKTEVMTLYVNAPAPVLLVDQALPSTETFTYLGSVVRQD